MVGQKTTTTLDGRRIDELPIPERGKLRLESDIPSVPTHSVIEEPGQYRIIRVGDTNGSPEENTTLRAFAPISTHGTMKEIIAEKES